VRLPPVRDLECVADRSIDGEDDRRRALRDRRSARPDRVADRECWLGRAPGWSERHPQIRRDDERSELCAEDEAHAGWPLLWLRLLRRGFVAPPADLERHDEHRREDERGLLRQRTEEDRERGQERTAANVSP